MSLKKESLPQNTTINLKVEILQCSELLWYAFFQTPLGFGLLCLQLYRRDVSTYIHSQMMQKVEPDLQEGV